MSYLSDCREFTVSIEPDNDHGAPWDEECGHGDVSEWTTRSKLPGELVLSSDHSSYRYYDFAGACRIARRDGWGFLPSPLKTRALPDGNFEARSGSLAAVSDDVNKAIRALYAAHRATFPSDRAYAAAAAMADYDRLRGWCDDQWCYVGVIVTDDETGESESLWGIESDADDYLHEVAAELTAELKASMSESNE